jgi:hypothetical protein
MCVVGHVGRRRGESWGLGVVWIICGCVMVHGCGIVLCAECVVGSGGDRDEIGSVDAHHLWDRESALVWRRRRIVDIERMVCVARTDVGGSDCIAVDVAGSSGRRGGIVVDDGGDGVGNGGIA